MNKNRYKEVLTIALPATLESLFVVLITMLDTKMVSPLGTTAISAIVLATQPKLFLFMVFTAMAVAITIAISHAYGNKDQKKANGVLVFSLLASLILAAVISVAAIFLAKPIMIVCSNQEDTMDMSVLYLQILMGGLVFQALSTVMNAALRGIGNMKATMISSLVTGVFDIFFNYLFIEGHWGCPAWGVGGAALATSLSYVAGFLVSLTFLFLPKSFLNIPFCIKNKTFINKEIFHELFMKFIMVLGENILTRVGFLVSGIIVARLGSYQTSIYSVGTQLLSLSFAFGDGISAATLVLVGRSVGSKDMDGCKAYIKTGLICSIFIAAFVTVANASMGRLYYSMFNQDEEFLQTGMYVALFAASVVPFQVFRMLRVGIMRGLGDTKRPAIIATIAVLAVDPPLAFLLAIVLGMGQYGLWIATLTSQVTWYVLSEIFSRRLLSRFQLKGTETQHD